MKTIALVGCGKTKLNNRALAKNLYTGPLFKKSRAWAERFADEWGILSAKHFLVDPNEKIDPYEQSLDKLDKDYTRQWISNTSWFIAHRWLHVDLKEVKGIDVQFVLLASESYARCFTHAYATWTREHVDKLKTPLAGMSIGQRLKWLNEQLSQK